MKQKTNLCNLNEKQGCKPGMGGVSKASYMFICIYHQCSDVTCIVLSCRHPK